MELAFPLFSVVTPKPSYSAVSAKSFSLLLLSFSSFQALRMAEMSVISLPLLSTNLRAGDYKPAPAVQACGSEPP